MDSLQITAYNIYDEDGTYKGTVYSEAEMESTTVFQREFNAGRNVGASTW